MQPAIVQAMRKAQAEGKAAAKETDGAERFPKRQRIQAVFFSPSKNQAAAGQPAKVILLMLLRISQSQGETMGVQECGLLFKNEHPRSVVVKWSNLHKQVQGIVSKL